CFLLKVYSTLLYIFELTSPLPFSFQVWMSEYIITDIKNKQRILLKIKIISNILNLINIREAIKYDTGIAPLVNTPRKPLTLPINVLSIFCCTAELIKILTEENPIPIIKRRDTNESFVLKVVILNRATPVINILIK